MKRITGWTKLNHRCSICKEDHSDISFEIFTSGEYAPNGSPYMQGIYTEYFHWKCLPKELKEYQAADEKEWIKLAQQPF